MTPSILGQSHLSLSVRDRGAAKRFWIDVLGFELVEERDEFCFVFDRGAGLAIILSDHRGTVAGRFDERNVGLDHVAYAAPNEQMLLSWEQRLTQFGIEHSPITESDGGHHLNLRAPDNVPVELFVIKPELAAALDLSDRDPVAATHR